MKQFKATNGAARAMALLGVLMFGFGIFPFANPIQFGFIFGQRYLPASLFSLVGSVPALWIALRLSREAQQKKDESPTS